MIDIPRRPCQGWGGARENLTPEPLACGDPSFQIGDWAHWSDRKAVATRKDRFWGDPRARPEFSPHGVPMDQVDRGRHGTQYRGRRGRRPDALGSFTVCKAVYTRKTSPSTGPGLRFVPRRLLRHRHPALVLLPNTSCGKPSLQRRSTARSGVRFPSRTSNARRSASDRSSNVHVMLTGSDL